jgi:hypothetical protein
MHTYANKYVPSRARLVRAHARRHARAHAAGPWDRGGRGHSQCLQVGPVGRHRQRREPGVERVPARHQCGRRRAAPAPPLPRGRRPRAPAMRAGSARPTTGTAAVAASTPRGTAQRPARQRTRQQRSDGTAANAHGGGGGADAQGLQELAPAEPLGELFHLRVVDDPTRAPAAQHRADVGSTGRINRTSNRRHARTPARAS